jgi:3-hydroxyacyl-CoA dehydrogenase/enoyl-CoA hydratase/3-hydroxybutyryl-CoA epimerase
LNEAFDIFDREPPKALIIRSGKANGFIAGADVTEFGELADPDAAMALVKRGWDTFMRLAKVRYPTLALIKGFCLGGGLELSLACRYRVVVDEPGRGSAFPKCCSASCPDGAAFTGCRG